MLTWLLCAACTLLLASPLHAIPRGGAHAPDERPKYTEYATMARWLVHKSEWGTLSTISRQLSGRDQPVPFGNAVSISDGPVERSTGRLLFYLTVEFPLS